MNEQIYFLRLYGGTSDRYFGVRRDGDWYLIDGTGWSDRLDPRQVLSYQKAPEDFEFMRPSVVYENTYPLTDFFPKDDEPS